MNCTTHHHACDCREAAHADELAQLRAEIARYRAELREIQGIASPGSWPYDRVTRVLEGE